MKSEDAVVDADVEINVDADADVDAVAVADADEERGKRGRYQLRGKGRGRSCLRTAQRVTVRVSSLTRTSRGNRKWRERGGARTKMIKSEAVLVDGKVLSLAFTMDIVILTFGGVYNIVYLRVYSPVCMLFIACL